MGARAAIAEVGLPPGWTDCRRCGTRLGPEEIHVCYDLAKANAPTLQRFLESEAFVRLIIGPWGSGKSSACCMDLLLRAQEVPRDVEGKRRSRWAIIRNTYRELEDTTRKTFEEWMPTAKDPANWSAQDFSFTLRIGDVEAEYLFRALDRPDHVKKLLSLELTGAYLNECKEIPRAIFDAVPGRTGRFPRIDSIPPENWWVPGLVPYWHGVWADTNPPDTDHYLYRLFEEERPIITIKVAHRETGEMRELERRFELFRQPGGRSAEAENLPFLQPGYYDTLSLGKGPDWIKVNVDGQYGFVKDGRPVYPEWNDLRHFDPAVLANAKWGVTIGQDFGLTPAATLFQRDPADGQWQAFDELVGTDIGAVRFGAELARKLKAEYPGRPVRAFGDPAGEQRAQTDERTPFDIMNAAGVPMVAAPTNDFTLRREAIAGLLLRNTMTGRPAMVVGPRCPTLRKAMSGGYCFKRLRIAGDERFHDKPDKGPFSHVAESAQYAMVGEGEDRRAVHGEGAGRKVKLPFKVKRAIGGW